MNHPYFMPKSTAMPAELADLLQVKRTLAKSMKSRRLTVAGLAKQLGTGRTAVRRALDVKNTSTTFKTIQRTARALGYTVKLEARPLTPKELGNLAQKMVDAKTSEEGERLQKELVDGFFGHAEGSA
jgi:predicted transcriptional regulator